MDPECNSPGFKSILQANVVHLQRLLEYEEQVCKCQTLRLVLEDLQKRLEEKDDKLTEANKVIRALRDEVQTLQQQLEQHRRHSKYRDDDTIGQRHQQDRRARENDITALGCEIPPNVFLSCTSGDDPADTPTSPQELTLPQELEDDWADFPASPAAEDDDDDDDDDALTSSQQLKLPVMLVKLQDCRELLGPDRVFKIKPMEDISYEGEDDDYGDDLCHQDDECDDRDYDPRNDGFDFCCINKEPHSSPEESTAEPELPTASPNQEVDEPCNDNHTAHTREGSQVNSMNAVKSKSKYNDPHECDVCGKILSCKKSLRRHQKVHSQQRQCTAYAGEGSKSKYNGPYECDVCGKILSAKRGLRIHKRIHTGERPHPCALCERTFRTFSHLYRHQKVHSQQRQSTAYAGEGSKLKYRGPHECDVCGKILSGKTSLIHHKRTHTGERPHPCALCERAFRTSSHLRRHQKVVHSQQRHSTAHAGEGSKLKHNGPHECDLCGKILSSGDGLRIHKRTHTGERPHPCAQCGRAFTTFGNLRRHQNIAHSQQSQTTALTREGSQVNSRNPVRSTSNYNSPHECDVCGQILLGKRSLMLHKRTHTGEKPYLCADCGKTFRTSSHLWRHKRAAHSHQMPEGSRMNSRNPVKSKSKYHGPHECDVCGKILSGKKSLILHKRTHTGEKPHPCSLCGRAFRTLGNLCSHKKVVHSQQRQFAAHTGEGSQVNSGNPVRSTSKYYDPSECDVCGKILASKKGLLLHKRTHTGEKPHPCSLCGRAFRTLGNLWCHKKIVHSQQRQSTDSPNIGSCQGVTLTLQSILTQHSTEIPLENAPTDSAKATGHQE
ncbi:zinc finger protein 271-like [Engraulis encrasicolus]|uniref:zinc finger protein 271-like n=1 Tax=Engraulis encrasicolus TaxID=184585 RepID=UPI002FD4E251